MGRHTLLISFRKGTFVALLGDRLDVWGGAVRLRVWEHEGPSELKEWQGTCSCNWVTQEGEQGVLRDGQKPELWALHTILG